MAAVVKSPADPREYRYKTVILSYFLLYFEIETGNDRCITDRLFLAIVFGLTDLSHIWRSFYISNRPYHGFRRHFDE